MPVECFEEVKDGSRDGEKDLLFSWIQEAAIKKALVLGEEVNPILVQRVVSEGYSPDLTDTEIEEIGHDPFLIAYALAKPQERCVVTTEVSSPRKTRKNRKIPDVCNDFNLNCCNQYKLNRELGFSTSWNRQA